VASTVGVSAARQLPLIGESSGAIFSPCEIYRYRLWRRWGKGPHCAWIMLNPSTANEIDNDPTIRRCIGFARAWGFSGVEIVNIFALRSTDPRGLLQVEDPIGPDNDRHIREAAVRADMVIAAWGVHGELRGRGAAVRAMLGDVRCLGVTKDGHPKHPLYLPKTAQPRPF
jgi:hypothetical protein